MSSIGYRGVTDIGHCITKYDFQDWPNTGKLKVNANKSLSYLERLLKGKNWGLYAYVVGTVEYDEDKGKFSQKGSGPNFQGGLITLCTCKHQMRSSKEKIEDWKNRWVAGFSGLNEFGDRNYLFYLMKVKDVYKSHMELWASLKTGVRKAKNATESQFGDLYKPKPNTTGHFTPGRYERPHANHVHNKDNEWLEDICYKHKIWRRRPARLVGDPDYSFLWEEPMIYLKSRLPRDFKKYTAEKFIQQLDCD